MTSFGWKKKSSNFDRKRKTKAFDPGEQVDDSEVEVDTDFDWINVAKKKKLDALEDNRTLFIRLKQEGILLAEQGKYWQAINRWDNALSLDSSDETVFEMKAQAQINLHEWIPAISSAQQCINIKPNWYIGHQTLGRAQMGLGEVQLAVKSFQKAVHLNPDDQDLRKNDLEWAMDLLNQKDKKMKNETESESSNDAEKEQGKINDKLVKLRS